MADCEMAENQDKTGTDEEDRSEGGSQSTGLANTTRLGKCEVCAAQEAVYTCPKCEVKTCSVRCVKIHKKELACDGIRDRTKFIPIRQMSKMDFMSDYYFLEECTRYVEDRKSDKIKSVTRFNKLLPIRLFRLRNAAAERHISLQFLLQNFSRHKENTTFYDWKEQKIYWHVEWIFVNASGRKYVDDRCPEDKKLCELLDKYVNPDSSEEVPQKKALEYYQSVDTFNLKLYLKAEGLKRCGSRYYLLDIGKTLKENLCKKAIVEFPTIYVSYEGATDAFDIIDSDEDVSSELEAYKTLVTTQYSHLKRSLDNVLLHDKSTPSDEQPVQPNLPAKKRKTKSTQPDAFEKLSTNYLFTDDKLLDALSSSSSSDNETSRA